MIAGANKNWRELLGIADWKPPDFFSSKADIDAAESIAPQALALRRAFDRLRLDGILCLQNNPVVYFKEVPKTDPAEEMALHRQFWNQGIAPILVLIDAREVRVYSGLTVPATRPEDFDGGNRLVEQLNRVADEAKIRQLVLSIASGEFFRVHPKSFDPNQRVDRTLLRNLQATRNALTAASSRKLQSHVLDALLCRIVFVCYLFDRNVIGAAYLQSLGIPSTNHLRDILGRSKHEAKAQLYALFKQLGADFNGDLFNDNLDEESRGILGRHLEILDQFLRGTDIATGQRSFWSYDFSMIPIETISAVYEHFLQAEDPAKKRGSGAFYTPRFLAEVTLDIALDGAGALLGKRFLDPACGSGIFLVGMFNRLAEEWKRNNPNRRYDRLANALIDILRRSLCGVDVNPTACRIAAFSLYLALLDQLSPPDIQELQRKGKMLPQLVSFSVGAQDGNEPRTIRCGDFFSDETAGAFDVVVGNPPWKSLDGPLTKAETWCEEHHYPIANRQLAIAFVWKGARHQRPGGRVCFVLPHGVLFNHQGKAIEFQKSWLERCSVDVVLNLADMRFNLFESAVGPALVVRYGANPPRHRNHVVRYLVPKTNWSMSHAEIISIAPEDRSEFRVGDVLADLRAGRPSRVWKERFWGTPRDWKLLDRLADIPALCALAGPPRSRQELRWIIAEGIQPIGKSDKPTDAKTIDLPTRLFVPATNIADVFVLSRADCQTLPQPKFRVRRRTNTDIFRAPHVLVTKGLNVAFADFPVAFRHAVRGIHGPARDREILLFLAAYLRSPLARYFLFHTSSRWGIERAEVEVAELLRVPFPLPEQTHSPTLARKLVNEIARKIDAYSHRNVAVLRDRRQEIQDIQSECDALIYEYFAIDDTERALVEDTVSLIMKSILPPRASAGVPTLKESSPEGRKHYAEVLCDTLNDWAREGPYRIYARVDSSLDSGVAVVVLDRKTDGRPKKGSIQESDGLLSLIDRLRNTFRKDLGSVELLRGVKVFDQDNLYVFKPLDQRFWTNTAALNDADEIATTVLLRSRQERPGW
jgi:hypothetical protein